MNERTAIVGFGYDLPAKIRTNDDPIFDWIKKHNPAGTKLFQGYKERRVLSGDETIVDILVPAAQNALVAAGLTAADIDVLTGNASVSEYITPSQLTVVHDRLGLREDCGIVPLGNEFTNLHSGIMLGNHYVEAGTARNVMVLCGCNWTKYVDYHTPQSVSAADGAGAVIIGRTTNPAAFHVAEVKTLVKSQAYGCMYMVGDPVELPDGKTAYTSPYFHINAEGLKQYQEFGEKVPAKLTVDMLTGNGLTGEDITLISHQSSSVLVDAWQSIIQPAQYIQSVAELANMTLANVPVNFAKHYDEIEKDWLVFLGVGAELQTTTMLLRRNA